MKSLIRTTILLIISLLALLSAPAHALDIAVIQSADIPPYNLTLEGFKDECTATYREFVMKPGESSAIVREIRQARPDVILTIGLRALRTAREIKNIPIIYTMVSNPGSLDLNGRNVAGVSMNISAKRQLRELLKEIPDIQSIGIIYDPANTGTLFNEARSAAQNLGVSIVYKEVRTSGEVPDAINSFKGKIDAYWMLPDTTVITREGLEYLLLFSFQNNVPILTFSDKYLEMGAFLSLGIDARDIGKQACGMARKVIKGQKVTDQSPRKVVPRVNNRTGKKFGFLDDEQEKTFQ